MIFQVTVNLIFSLFRLFYRHLFDVLFIGMSMRKERLKKFITGDHYTNMTLCLYKSRKSILFFSLFDLNKQKSM